MYSAGRLREAAWYAAVVKASYVVHAPLGCALLGLCSTVLRCAYVLMYLVTLVSSTRICK